MIRHRNYLAITLHLIWSTGGRQPYISADVEKPLFDYCVAIARRKKCDVLAIGGTENHIHLLVTFPATIRLCDLLRDLKAGSSHFMRETLRPNSWFEWQDSYATIAVCPSHRKRIIAYIHNQKQHHADGTTNELLERDGEIYDSETDDPSGGRDAEGA